MLRLGRAWTSMPILTKTCQHLSCPYQQLSSLWYGISPTGGKRRQHRHGSARRLEGDLFSRQKKQWTPTSESTEPQSGEISKREKFKPRARYHHTQVASRFVLWHPCAARWALTVNLDCALTKQEDCAFTVFCHHYFTKGSKLT